MRPEVCWIDVPGERRLAIMPRPRAGDWLDDEIAGWRSERIDAVVSLLEADEVAELGLDREAKLCGELGIEFISYPIPDRGVPASLGTVAKLVRVIAARMDDGKGVAIHCRAGIGRSSLIAACTLAVSGLDHELASGLIAKARGIDVPKHRGTAQLDRDVFASGGNVMWADRAFARWVALAVG